MTGRHFGIRQMRWQAYRGAVYLWPALRDRVLLYESVARLESAGTADIVEDTADLILSDAQRRFTDCLLPGTTLANQRRVPARLERRTALITLEGVTLLGNTGAIIHEKRRELLLPRGIEARAMPRHLRPGPLRRRRHTGAPPLSMVGEWKGHRHLFHFLFDRVPRVYAALERFGLKDGPLEILVNEGLPPFQADFYKFLQSRYPSVSITTVPVREAWRFDRLLTVDNWQNTTRTVADPAFVDWVRALYLGGYGVAPTKGTRRLWISREDAKKRRLLNESELEPVLRKHGFETVLLGRLPFREQVTLFANAQAVAGTHGMGLTHLLFAKTGTAVLELFPETCRRNTYLLLSHTRSHHYAYAIGGPGDRRDRYRLAPDTLDKALTDLRIA